MGVRTAAVIASLLCGLSVATEAFAYLTRLAPELGAPLWRHGWLAFYGPWMILIWAWQWAALIPRPFEVAGALGLILGGLTLARLWPRERRTADQARWATTQDLTQAECLSQTGIVLGEL